MLRYRDGDAAAFEALYARHKAPLYRYFVRMARPTTIAEELFQDVWMSVIRTRTQYQVRAKFSTWLYRMAHNRLIDHYRRSAVGLPLSYDDDTGNSEADSVPDSPLHEPDNALDRRRLAQRIAQAIAELPEAQRETFLLREEGGLSLEEIAATTRVNTETAKSRLRYAVSKLRRLLASASAGDGACASQGTKS